MRQPEVLSLALTRDMLADGRVRQLRIAHRFSKAEIALGVGVTPAAYARWERGDVRPRKAHALALAELLGELIALDLTGLTAADEPEEAA